VRLFALGLALIVVACVAVGVTVVVVHRADTPHPCHNPNPWVCVTPQR
jgi:hypothetical protein